MAREHDDYVLRTEITDMAKAKTKKGSVVISVRLSAAEFARLEYISQSTGTSVSRVVREAIAQCSDTPDRGQLTVTISTSDLQASFGDTREISGTLTRTPIPS